jgi:hypothetical protein
VASSAEPAESQERCEALTAVATLPEPLTRSMVADSLSEGDGDGDGLSDPVGLGDGDGLSDPVGLGDGDGLDDSRGRTLGSTLNRVERNPNRLRTCEPLSTTGSAPCARLS